MPDDSNSKTRFQKNCERIFLWAGYRSHTITHRNRFPLIGSFNAWERLEDRLTIQVHGNIPEAPANDSVEHVLDVMIHAGQDLSSNPLVDTDMYTIVFEDPDFIVPQGGWRAALTAMHGTLASIDVTLPTNCEAADGTVDVEESASEDEPAGGAEPPEPKIVILIDKKASESKERDVLSFHFRAISDALSAYQEEKIKKLMQSCGALEYNSAISRNDPPDGYYLCNSECLCRLKVYFNDTSMTLATRNTHFQSPKANKYILLTVEVKLTMDSLQSKLSKSEYYIFQRAPHPIRNLIIVNGGQVTRTWLFLISIAQMDFLPRPSHIDPSIYARSHEIAQRLAIGNTHVVYEQCVSSETFREGSPGTACLEMLGKLVVLQKAVTDDETRIRDLPDSEKQPATRIKNQRKQTATKKMMSIIADLDKRKPRHQPRSSMNELILLQPKMRTPGLLCFYEELSLSLLREHYRKTARRQQKLAFPQSLVIDAWKKRKRQTKKTRRFGSDAANGCIRS